MLANQQFESSFLFFLLSDRQMITILQKNNKDITHCILYHISLFRKRENKMINFNKWWKNKKYKRTIQEVMLSDIQFHDYKLIDVRSRREFREHHLNGAMNIPLPEIKQNVEHEIKNKNSKVLVYCQSGIRSKKAAEIMEIWDIHRYTA